MNGEVFPRSHRLARRSDFRKTYDEGRKLAGRYLVLFVRPNEVGNIRLGLTVTKRAGCAAERNRARRRLREIFRTEARATLERNRWTGTDVVVNLREGGAAAGVRELSEDFGRLLRRLGERRS
ncbi:MAG TPA: ribonuclease P protein component [Thermoanaerobaculia bacterium]